MTYIPVQNYYYTSPVTHLYQYFKSKGALSEEKAIVMRTIDWVDAGSIYIPGKSIFTPFKGFIKQDSTGKYWFDETGLENYLDNQNRFIKFFFLAILGIFVLMVLWGITFSILGI